MVNTRKSSRPGSGPYISSRTRSSSRNERNSEEHVSRFLFFAGELAGSASWLGSCSRGLKVLRIIHNSQTSTSSTELDTCSATQVHNKRTEHCSSCSCQWHRADCAAVKRQASDGNSWLALT